MAEELLVDADFDFEVVVVWDFVNYRLRRKEYVSIEKEALPRLVS